MGDSTDQRRVDEIRQQLRSLGYLDAGVNRFVLGPVTETRSPSLIAILAALRVGAIAALLLGPAAAVGLNGRLPGLVTGPRDAIVLAGYLAALFGTAVCLLAFTGSLAVAFLAARHTARRARTWSRMAGATLAAGCLIYLTLWWRTANAGFGWNAPVWTAFALTTAVVISLLLGSVATSAAFAVAIARAHPDARPASPLEASHAPMRSWRLTIAAGVLAFTGAAALLVVTAPRATSGTAHVPLAVVSSGVRIRLIAIDGVDVRVLEALIAEGRVPALSRALVARARLPLSQTESPRDPARGWTTVATGQMPEAHGVHGLETRRVTGLQGIVAAGEQSRVGNVIRAATDLLRLTRPSIASGNERRVKTVWEVAQDAGLRTAVVNWWATWPAAAEEGNAVVSDRAVIRLERGGPLDAEIAPASLYDRLRERWPEIRREAAANAHTASTSLSWGDTDDRTVLERSANLDALQLALLREVSDRTPDFSAVYLPGLDIAQHALLGARESAPAPSDLAARVQALRDYQVFLDRLLAEALVPNESEIVIVVTEPGRVAAAADGLFSVAGTGAASPTTSDGGGNDLRGRPTDVAATVLQLLGLPISRELAGSPLLALLDADFVRRYPVRHVDSYGPPSEHVQNRSGTPLDQEMIDRLRSLGYVK